MKTVIFVFVFVAFVPLLCEENSLVGFRLFYHNSKGFFGFNRRAQKTDIITALVTFTLCALQTLNAFIKWRTKPIRLYRGSYRALNRNQTRGSRESCIERIMFKSGDNFIPVTAMRGTLGKLSGSTIEMLIWFILHEQLRVNLRILTLFPINHRGPVYTVQQILEGNTEEFRALRQFLYKEHGLGRYVKRSTPFKGRQATPSKKRSYNGEKRADNVEANGTAVTSGNQERGKDISKNEHFFAAVKPEKVVEIHDNMVEVNANNDDCESDYEPANAMRKALTMIFSKVKADETGSNEHKVEGREETPSRTKDSLEKLDSNNSGKETLVTDECLMEAAGQGKKSDEFLNEAAAQVQTSDECLKEAVGQGQTSNEFLKKAAGQGQKSDEFLKKAAGHGQKSDEFLKEAAGQGQTSNEFLTEAVGHGQISDEYLKKAAGQGKTSEEILKEAAGRGQTSDECSQEAAGQVQTSDKFLKGAAGQGQTSDEYLKKVTWQGQRSGECLKEAAGAGQGRNSNEFLKEASGEQKSDPQCLEEAPQSQKSDQCLVEAAGKGQRSDQCLKETAEKGQKSDESFKEASGGQTFEQGLKDARQGQKSVECVKEAVGQRETSDECLKEAAAQGPKSDDCVKQARKREKSTNASTPKESVHHMIEMITSMFDPPCLGNRAPDGDESFLDRKLKKFNGDNLKPPSLFHEDVMHKGFEEESILYSDDMSEDLKKTLKAYYGMARGFTSGTTVATDFIEQEKQEEKEAYNISAQEWETLDNIFKERIHLKDSVKIGENYVHIPPDSSSRRQIQAGVAFDGLEKKASCRHGWNYPKIVIGGGSVALALFVVYRYFRHKLLMQT